VARVADGPGRLGAWGRPPPSALGVSKKLTPDSKARSISSRACSSVSPMPKKAGAEPMPPKLPQPSPSREIFSPVEPSRRYSMTPHSVLDVALRDARRPAGGGDVRGSGGDGRARQPARACLPHD